MLEEDLTQAEKLFLVRRRLGLQSADLHAWGIGVDRSVYQQWEAGTLELPPNIQLHGLYPWEHYAILRMRAGLSEAKLARIIGVGVRNLARMERGRLPLKRLIEYWGH